MELHHRRICTTLWFILITAFVGFISCQEANEPTDIVITTCTNYEIHFSTWLREFYTCCRTVSTDAASTDAACTEELERVPNFQCKKEETYQTKHVISLFSCNGDIGLKNAQKRCNRRWAWLEPQERDKQDCFVWSKCFEGACKAERNTKGLSISGDFCGDGKCDPATENGTSCPLDCCPQVNPEQCQIVNNTCSDPCCGEKFCCNEPKDSQSSGGLDTFVWIVLGIVGGVILLNILCCCCCVCCARRCCKSHKKQKFDERNPPENPDVKRVKHKHDKQYKKSHSSPV